jgi:hypothetical protein
MRRCKWLLSLIYSCLRDTQKLTRFDLNDYSQQLIRLIVRLQRAKK